MKLLYLLVPVLFLQVCKSQSPSLPSSKDDNTLLWEITGKGIKPSYLFGTFHMMCKDDIHTSKNLMEAIRNTDEVYFELDLDDMSGMLGALLFMKMKNDTTLKDLYTDEQYKKVESYFRDSLNMPIGMMNNLKPLFLQALLYPKLMPCKTVSGMEEALMKIAKENKKEIRGLETIEFQASVFDSIPYDVQAKELLKGIDSIHDYKDEFSSMLNVYKTQRLSEIEKFFNTSEFGLAENQDILLDKRNINWVSQLKDLLPKKTMFIAVGAGHLVGKKGVITLLREEGYTLRPVQN